MGGLMYKDFLTNRKSIFIALGAMLYCGMMIIIPSASESVKEDMGIFMQLYGILPFVAMFFINGAFQGNILKSDENKKWAYFITSTPMLKKHIEAKYWFIMIMSFATVFVTAIFDAVNCMLSDTQSLQLLIMMMFYIQIFMRAIEIPFLVRFGSIGSYYKAGVFLLVILVAGIYLLFGDLSHFSSMDKVYELLLGMITGENRVLIVTMTVLPYISAVSYYLSFKISCRLYLKGVENFEK